MVQTDLPLTDVPVISRRGQAADILDYLKSGKRLTSLEALNLFACARLASRINELRNDGHDIKTRMITLPTGKRVAQYFMEVLMGS